MQALHPVSPVNFAPETPDPGKNTEVTKFQLFQQNPSWDTYCKMSLLTKYLITARYYSSKQEGRRPEPCSRYQYLKSFEKEFRKNPNLDEWQQLNQAIQEIILIKQKIKIIKCVQNLQCDDEQKLGRLFALDSSIHQMTIKILSKSVYNLNIILSGQISDLEDGKLD